MRLLRQIIELGHVISGRWPPKRQPTTEELIVSAILLCLMALAVTVGWSGGETFLYEGF